MSKNKKQKNERKGQTTTGKTYTGKLDITRSGMGFVIVDGLEKDIIIRHGNFGVGLHGDIVSVSILPSNKKSRLEGVVDAVLTRKQSEFIGTLQMGTNFAFCIVDTDKPMPDFYIPLEKINGATNKDKVIVKLVEWTKSYKSPIGEVVDILNQASVSDAAMKQLLLENGFAIAFDEKVMQEVAALPETISVKEIKARKDIRNILTFTIDPVDAKDFDDAISFQVLKNGNYEIGVHIADVSHYVQPGTALDAVAYAKATSVYLPDRVSPMLPERISNELCSLRPHEDKLSFSAIFEISPSGNIKKEWIGRTVMHSNHRFTYEDAQVIIEGGDGKFKEEILIINKLAQQYRADRMARGAINFSSQEVRFKLDETGKPIGIMVKESKESHQLIEEFMLLANRTIAAYVAGIKVPPKGGTLNRSLSGAEGKGSGKGTLSKAEGKEVPFAYRVHDTPSEEKLEIFASFAKRYGHKFNTKTPEAIAESFNQMLIDAKGKPEQHVLESLGIRTMAKATYTTKNIGHYGLGFEYYCHFTSPIRRYPDVLVHRTLQDCLNGKPTIDNTIEEKCKHCSGKERDAMDTERAANKYKQVEFLMDHVGEEFEAVVSGVASFGFWAETVEHKCEGLVSINELMYYDHFVHSESDYSLTGLQSGIRFAIGDKVKIKVVVANLEKRQLDFEWVTERTARRLSGAEAPNLKKIKNENKNTKANPKKEIRNSKSNSNTKTKKRKK